MKIKELEQQLNVGHDPNKHLDLSNDFSDKANEFLELIVNELISRPCEFYTEPRMLNHKSIENLVNEMGEDFDPNGDLFDESDKDIAREAAMILACWSVGTNLWQE